MREIIIGPDALLTAVALTTTALTNASLTVTFILATNYYKIEQFNHRIPAFLPNFTVEFFPPKHDKTGVR